MRTPAAPSAPRSTAPSAPRLRARARRLTATVALAALVGAVGCAGSSGGSREDSDMARWIDKPTKGTTAGNLITVAPLGVKFEIPDTLYVFKDCAEADHRPEGENKWIPILSCSSRDYSEVDGTEAGQVEQISLTFYVTRKTRPLDERSVAYFEDTYKAAGIDVEQLSYNDDYQKKAGIYSVLRLKDKSTGAPVREIVQFMFPRQDVVFIARMEYPFGETRSVEQDWKYIMWNFDWIAGDAG